jgi:hypothetical protein
MRLPRPRFTVRRLMLVIALAGAGAWGVKMWRLSREHAGRAQSASANESFYHWMSERSIQNATLCEELAARMPYEDAERRDRFVVLMQQRALESREDAAKWRAEAEHYAASARKYDRAARYPWLGVGPDAPAP